MPNKLSPENEALRRKMADLPFNARQALTTAIAAAGAADLERENGTLTPEREREYEQRIEKAGNRLVRCLRAHGYQG